MQYLCINNFDIGILAEPLDEKAQGEEQIDKMLLAHEKETGIVQPVGWDQYLVLNADSREEAIEKFPIEFEKWEAQKDAEDTDNGRG